MPMPVAFDRSRRRVLVVGAACSGALGVAAQAASTTVLGQGASFPSKVYQAWARRFAELSGIQVVYKPTGSGDGVVQATDRRVDFGGTDSPLPEVELERRKLVQVPMLVGGVVPVVNLRGLGTQRLVLSGELLAALMQGEVGQWNDPRVAALNPGLALPAQRVQRVVRGERSGTTEAFTRYLAEASPAFRERVGSSQAPRWPGDVLAADGSDGLVAQLQATPGGLGYVSFDRAGAAGLAGVALRNRDGQVVTASEAGFRAAMTHSDLYRQGLDSASLLDRPGLQTWPITLTSFVLLDAEPPATARIEPALRFLYWCFMRGDELTRGTGFAALPLTAQARFAVRFARVQPRDGGKPEYQTF